MPWGDVCRIRWAGKDLPAEETWGEPLGGVRVASYTADPDGKQRGNLASPSHRLR